MADKMIATMKDAMGRKTDPNLAKEEFSNRLRRASESSAPIRSRISLKDAFSQFGVRLTSLLLHRR